MFHNVGWNLVSNLRRYNYVINLVKSLGIIEINLIEIYICLENYKRIRFYGSWWNIVKIWINTVKIIWFIIYLDIIQ